MKRSRMLALAAVTVVAAAAYAGYNQASATPSDLVARAAGQELSTERLASIMANSPVALQPDVARVVTELWISYQLLGAAGARGDSLLDPKIADGAMWFMIDSAKVEQFIRTAAASSGGFDTTGLEQRYLHSDFIAAQHILILMPENGAGLSQQKQDSIRRVAEDIRKQVTEANFSEMAKQYTEEPGGKDNSGNLGVYAFSGLTPPFANAVRALAPGAIAPGVVQTSYGFHIIRRNLLSEVRGDFIAKESGANADSDSRQLVAKLEADRKLTVMPGITAKAKQMFLDPDAGVADKTVLATSMDGDFTAGRFAQHLQSYPPGTRMQFKQQADKLPDSVVTTFVRAFAGRDLVAMEADKAHMGIDSATIARIRGLFRQMIVTSSKGLKVDPTSLSDSATTPPEKQRLAAIRVEAALDQLFSSGGKDFVDMPQQLSSALREHYPWAINSAALEHAVTRGLAVRAALDSTRGRAK